MTAILAKPIVFVMEDFTLNAAQITALVLLIVWSYIWKGLALWKSARLNDTWWFVAFVFLNTAGILEILYLYVFSKSGEKQA